MSNEFPKSRSGDQELKSQIIAELKPTLEKSRLFDVLLDLSTQNPRIDISLCCSVANSKLIIILKSQQSPTEQPKEVVIGVRTCQISVYSRNRDRELYHKFEKEDVQEDQLPRNLHSLISSLI